MTRLQEWWQRPGLTGDAAVVFRQVRVAEVEAGFSLACTLAVCVRQEWGRWDQVAAAVAIPIAMAFSVHGLHNARGLGRWIWAYLPARVAVIGLGVAYSYQHYIHFLGELEVFGIDLRPWVAVTMELLTLSALVAHEAHATRLAALTQTPTTGPGPVVAEPPGPELAEPPADGLPGMTLAARLRQPGLNGHQIETIPGGTTR